MHEQELIINSASWPSDVSMDRLLDTWPGAVFRFPALPPGHTFDLQQRVNLWWQRVAQRQLVRGHLQCPVPLAGTHCRLRCGSVTSAWRSSRKNWKQFCSAQCWIDNSIDDWLLRFIFPNYMTVLNFNFGLTIYIWLFILSLFVPTAVLWDSI